MCGWAMHATMSAENGRGCECAIRTFALASHCPSLVRSQAIRHRGLPMSQMDHRAPSHDERWGDHVPFSLRFNIVIERGDLDKLLNMVATKLRTLFEHEFGYGNPAHFISRLTTESLGRFHAEPRQTYANMVYYYFSPSTIQKEIEEKLGNDPEKIESIRLLRIGDTEGFAKAHAIDRQQGKPDMPLTGRLSFQIDLKYCSLSSSFFSETNYTIP